MIHKKKERRRQVSAFPAIFKADFGLFRPFSACFSHFRPISIVSTGGRYDPILAESTRFSANQSRFDTNRAALAQIEPSRRESKKKKKKKKKNADADRHVGNHVGRRILCWAASDTGVAPLVLHLCFLVLLQEDYI